MGFDKESNAPIVQTHKKTTKVNIVIVASVLLFFALMGSYVIYKKTTTEPGEPGPTPVIQQNR